MIADYSCEDKLSKNDLELHKRYCGALFAASYVLDNYKGIFPEYTDHSFLHTMNIIEYCNKLIGSNINKMNAGEIYVMMMAAALHDIGMGISENDFNKFNEYPIITDYFFKNPNALKQRAIRDLHHELSGLLIDKYSALFEIPDEYVFPVIQASRGHRRTDLSDRFEYPVDFHAHKYSICLPYIASIIRLADELDIAAERNIYLNQDISSISNEYSLTVWKIHSAIKSVNLTEDKCNITVCRSELCDFNEFSDWISKLTSVFKYVTEIINGTNIYTFTNREVIVKYC